MKHTSLWLAIELFLAILGTLGVLAFLAGILEWALGLWEPKKRGSSDVSDDVRRYH